MRRRHLLATGLAASACTMVPGQDTPAAQQRGAALGGGATLLGTVALEGSGAAAGAVLPFAYAFPAGDLPRGTSFVVARGDSGTPLRTQLDVKTRWPDGSVKHALMAIEAPALADGALLPLQLRAGGEAQPPPGAAIDLAAALAGRSVVVEVAPDTNDGSGSAWRCDLLALLPTAAGARWRDGPLASEARVVADVPASALGTGVTEVQTVVRGSAAGGLDALPHSHVRRIVRANKGGAFRPEWGSFAGGTEYHENTNWVRSGEAISWAPTGPEPAAGESYAVVYTRATTAGQIRSMRLVADLMLLKDGSLWCDLAMRNDAAMRAGGGTATYSLRLLLDGARVLEYQGVAQGPYQAFVRRRGVGRGGAPAAARPSVRPDVQHLADAGAVHRYDARLGAAPDRKTFFVRLPDRPDWDLPFSPRGFARAMPMAGGRWEIGAATEPQAMWLMSGERAIQRVCLDQSEALAGVPWHFWDHTGGVKKTGGWLDPTRHPARWADARDPAFTPRPPLDTGWNPDTAHTPAGHYVPYLLTGRRSCLDGLQAQASYAVMAAWPVPKYRGTAVNPAMGEGLNIIRNQQVRAGAWSLRALLDAAYVSPPDNPNGDFWRSAAAGNLAWMWSQTPAWTRRHGQAHGYLVYPMEPPNTRLLSPWMNDFLVTSLWKASRAGFGDADRLLAWMKNWTIRRFLRDAEGFPLVDGTAYEVIAGPGDGSFYQTWAEVGAATLAAGRSNTTKPRTSGYFGPYGRATVAQYLELLPDDAEVRAAWDALNASNTRAFLATTPAELQRDCTTSIAPRGMARAR